MCTPLIHVCVDFVQNFKKSIRERERERERERDDRRNEEMFVSYHGVCSSCDDAIQSSARSCR